MDDYSLAREPSIEQWKVLRKLDGSVITVEEFLQRWKLNQAQLANVLGCDRATVRRFVRGDRSPAKQYQRRLALVDKLWSKN